MISDDYDIRACQRLLDSIRSCLEQCRSYDAADFERTLQDIEADPDIPYTKSFISILNKILSHHDFDRGLLNQF